MRRWLLSALILAVTGVGAFFLGVRYREPEIVSEPSRDRPPPATVGEAAPPATDNETSPPPGPHENPFGIFLNPRLFGIEERVQLARQLGARYFRSIPVLVPSWDGECPECAAVHGAGLDFVLTIRNSQAIEEPAMPATDLESYRQAVDEIIEVYRPVLVTVENEEETPAFYTGSPQQYAAQLRTACEVAHSREIKCANGGLLSGSVSYLVYQHYVETGQREQAQSFAQRAFEPFQRRRLESPGGEDFVRQLVEHVRGFLATYTDAGADYVNFHWYIGDAEALAEAVRYLEDATGLPAVTNEIGQRDLDPVTTRSLLESVVEMKLSYAVWFSSDARLSRALVERDGRLRDTGEAFRSFVRQRIG